MNTNIMRALVVVFTLAVVAAMSISAQEGASTISGVTTPVAQDTAVDEIKEGANTVKNTVTTAAEGAKSTAGDSMKNFKAPEDKADPVTEPAPAAPESGGCCG